MKHKKRVIVIILCLTMIAGLIFPAATVKAEETAFGNGVVVNLGDVLEISVNEGEKKLMGLYGGGMYPYAFYEGSVSLKEGENTYRIYANDKQIKEGNLNITERTGDGWIRYKVSDETVVTSWDKGVEYLAAWSGDFNAVKEATGENGEAGYADAYKYYFPESDYPSWNTQGSQIELNYIGGGVFEKTFTFDAMESEHSMDYKITFNGGWDGTVDDGEGGNRKLTFPKGSTSVTLWVNSLTKEAYAVTDQDSGENIPMMEEMQVSIGEKACDMVQVGSKLFIGTMQLESGSHEWTAGDKNGSFALSEKEAVTFLYDGENNTVLNSVSDIEALASAIRYSLSSAPGNGGEGPENGEFEGEPEESTVDLGKLVQVSVNGGEGRTLMSLYKDGMYEGKIALNGSTDTYQIFMDGEKIKEGTIESADERECWIRYSALTDEVVTQYDDKFLYPATWVGGFSAVVKEDGTKYLGFEDWAPGDKNANLDYKGGGVFQKKFTFDAIATESNMHYKIAFGGDWQHGDIGLNGNDKPLTFTAGCTEITLWVNSLTRETYDSINDANRAVAEKVQVTIDNTDYDMVQTGFYTFIGTVQLDAGSHTWKIAEKSGELELSKEAAVTFLYDAEKGTVLNSVMQAATLALAINYPISNDSGEGEDNLETDLKDVAFGEILEVSINGGEKTLMSPYYNGMFEGKAEMPSGKSTYRIYRNGKLAKIGDIAAGSGGAVWIRYWTFQDKVVTSYDDSDGFKYPATWVGSFSGVAKADGTKYFDFADWSPADAKTDLDYKGGGVFQKTFTFDAITANSNKDMEYKIAFGRDWNHGNVGLNGNNKPLAFPEGSTEITLWVNSLTSETYDSINDKDKVTIGAVGISIDDNPYDMIQTGFHTFMKSVLLGVGEHTYAIGETQSTPLPTISLSGQTVVTFWYDAKDGSILNSIDNLEELKGLTNWMNTINSDYPVYNGSDLGAVYTPSGTTFKVWAPAASGVTLNRYTKGSSREEGDASLGTVTMEKDMADGTWNGVWTTTVSGDLKNTYYTYSVTAGGTTKETNDIYAKAAGLNGDRGMVVDLDSTDPSDWSNDSHVMADKPTDAIVWEVNIRDFSSDGSSGVSEKNSGKYLAFTERETTVNGKGELSTGIDYLKELGVNYVQLLPVFDFVNDETDDNYNWGYAAKNYNVPEGVFSTNPYDGNVRINEFKQMVQALHENGIGVVMDVVFNHVGGDGKESWFNRTVPGYYFRQDEWGNFVDSGTACGNETASEAEMFRKYMIDSVVYWAEEYHIDGFRFDLMGCHDVETMNQLRKALDQLPDGEKILVYGEPWAAGATNQPQGVDMVSKDNMKLLDARIGAFNDSIRDAIKGRVYQDDGTNLGFIQASGSMDNKTMAALQANSNPDYDEPWAKQPSQAVSYVSVHDNLSLYDKLQCSVNGIKEEGDERYYLRDENLVKMNKMAAAAIATSQGIMFFQAGEEIARSKGGVEDSYESPLHFENGKELNQINWKRAEEFSDLLEYYKGLLELRKAYAPFRASDMTTIDQITFSDDEIANLVAYTINSPGAKWDMVAVLMNSNTEPQQVTLKAAEGVELPDTWNCVANQTAAGTKKLETYQGTTITVPAQTVLVLTAAEKLEPPIPSADKAGLEAALEKYENIKDNDAVKEAYENAQKVCNDSNVVQEDIDKALAAIEEAVRGIGLWIDKIPNQLYTGSAVKPEVKVYFGSRLLRIKTDYTVSYSNNINAGEATVKITGKGNFKDFDTENFIIEPKKLEELEIDSVYAVVASNGKLKNPAVKVKYGRKTLSRSKDYTITYPDDKTMTADKQGIPGYGYEIIIEAKKDNSGNYTGNYTGKQIVKYDVLSADTVLLGKVTAKVNPTKVEYKADLTERPVLTVQKGSGKKAILLNENEHYRIREWTGAQEAGKATIILEAVENSGYYGTKTVTYTVMGKAFKAGNIEIGGIENSYLYTGEEVTIDNLTVDEKYKDEANTQQKRRLVENKDYTVSYKKNTDAGTAEVTITGMGCYTGKVVKKFKIDKIDLSKWQTDTGLQIQFQNDAQAVYTKNGAQANVTVTYQGKQLALKTDYSISYSNNKKAVPGEKSATIKITGKGNFKGTIKGVKGGVGSFEVVPPNPETVSTLFDVKAADVVVPANVSKLKTSLKIYEKSTGKKLASNTDYVKTLKYFIREDNGTKRDVMQADLIPGKIVGVQIELKGQYVAAGTTQGNGSVIETTFRLYDSKKTASNFTVTKIPEQVYTGSEIRPKLEVRDKKNYEGDGKLLVEGVDYTVEYTNNTKKGTAKVTITGCGEDGYGGTKTVSFKITAAKVSIVNKVKSTIANFLQSTF